MDELNRYYVYNDQPNAHFSINFQLCKLSKESPLPSPSVVDKSVTTKDESKLVDNQLTPVTLKHSIEDYLNNLATESWTNWSVSFCLFLSLFLCVYHFSLELFIIFKIGNHDIKRAGSRFGYEQINNANVLNLLLGGTPLVYYGEEIGMTDLPASLLSFDDCRDEFGKKYGVRF